MACDDFPRHSNGNRDFILSDMMTWSGGRLANVKPSNGLLDLAFPEQPNPGGEGRDHQSRSQKSKQTGEF
jgi:hypothetical protein